MPRFYAVLPWHQKRFSKKQLRGYCFLFEIFKYDIDLNILYVFVDHTICYKYFSRTLGFASVARIIESLSLSLLFVQFVLTSANDPNAENEM